VVEVLDKLLPKPSEESYVEARLLEALVEARLALRFLREGIARNAAGKAFQAWKALLAALLRLELESLKALAKTEEEKARNSNIRPNHKDENPLKHAGGLRTCRTRLCHLRRAGPPRLPVPRPRPRHGAF